MIARGRARCGLDACRLASKGDAEPLHPAVEGGRFEPKRHGGPVGPLDMPTGSFERTEDVFALRIRHGTGWVSSGAASSSNGTFSVSPSLTIAPCSITLRSSRTLPGHGRRWSASIVVRGTWVIFLPMRTENSSRRVQTSRGMSSARSRSGGTRIGNTLRR